MNITKFAHACFMVEKAGQTVVVDPGSLSIDFTPADNTVAVIITHSHPDHLDEAKLQAIATKNPDVVIIAHQSITEQLSNFKTQTAKPHEIITIGDFKLEFTGGEHATIHASIPTIPNVGVIIDYDLYYPGDSLVAPDAQITTLAVPAGAPWLKVSEAMDFIMAIKPTHVFPTHDAVLSDAGKSFHDDLLKMACEKIGATYERL